MVGLVLTAVVALAVTIAVSTYIYYGRLYMRSRVAGAEVGFRRMFRMTASGVSAFRVVTAHLNARQAGFDLPLEQLEAYARSGRDPRDVARRLQAAKQSGERLSESEAFADAG